MTQKKLTSPVVIEFPDFKTVEPSDLITFSDEYEAHRAELVSTLQMIEGKNGFMLRTVRVGRDGNIKSLDRVGTVENLNKDGFTFISQMGGEGFKDDDQGEKTHIRFNNVLGEVPLLPSTQIENPFDFGSHFESYLIFQEKVRTLLKEGVGKTHKLTLHLRYGKDYPTRRNGKFFVEGEILKVNKSNLEINRLKSFSGNMDNYTLDIVPKEKAIRFITSKCYIWKVEYLPDVKNQINPFDTEEDC